MNQTPKSHEKRMPEIPWSAVMAVALIMVLLLAAACGGGEETKAPGAENAEAEETLPTETVIPAAIPTEVLTETGDAAPEPAGPEGTDVPEEAVATEQKPSLIPSTKISEGTATEQEPSLIPSTETSENQGEVKSIEELMAMFPAHEQECLPDAVKQGKDPMAANAEDGPLPEEALMQLMDCLSDESIALVMIIPILEEDGELSQETKDCISNGPTGSLLKKIITEIASMQKSENHEGAAQKFMAMTLGMMLSTTQCLNEEEATRMGMSLQERDALTCITGGDPENSTFVEDFMEAMITQDEEALATFENISEECYATTGVAEVPQGLEAKDPEAPQGPEATVPECERSGETDATRCL